MQRRRGESLSPRGLCDGNVLTCVHGVQISRLTGKRGGSIAKNLQPYGHKR